MTDVEPPEDAPGSLRENNVNERNSDWKDVFQALDRVIRELDELEEKFPLLIKELFLPFVIKYLERHGEKVVNVYSGCDSPVGEIDAIVETEISVYVIEIEKKAEIKDVDDVIAKAKAVRKEFGNKNVVPVITGSRISKVVREYAKCMNVLVI